MALNKKDFIEIEFTGRIKDTNEIFDSNIADDLKNSNLKVEPKPFVLALGEGMFLKGVEDFLIGKDLGKHKIELDSNNAFGKRDSKLIHTIPMKVFAQQQIRPIPGVTLNFDGRIGKVLTVSGGRVMTDFNHPLAGKDVTYEINVLRKVENIDEKVKALNEFLFRKDFAFEIKDKKLSIKTEKGFTKFVELFKDKFKELFNLELEVQEIEVKSN